MPQNMKLLLTGLCFLAATYNTRVLGEHLQCWHCSSDTIGSEDFCDVAFHEGNIPTEMIRERNISVMRSCNSTINSDHERAVCRKTVEETNGKIVTKRFCYYTNKSDSLDHCNEEPTEKNVRRIFCQDCLNDKCNSATHNTAMLGAISLPVFLAKMFTF